MGKIIEDKLHQEYYNVPTKDLPPRMQPRQLPNLQDAAKIDWDDWKKWEWMQPGWKGIKMLSVRDQRGQLGGGPQRLEVRPRPSAKVALRAGCCRLRPSAQFGR